MVGTIYNSKPKTQDGPALLKFPQWAESVRRDYQGPNSAHLAPTVSTRYGERQQCQTICVQQIISHHIGQHACANSVVTDPVGGRGNSDSNCAALRYGVPIDGCARTPDMAHWPPINSMTPSRHPQRLWYFCKKKFTSNINGLVTDLKSLQFDFFVNIKFFLLQIDGWLIYVGCTATTPGTQPGP